MARYIDADALMKKIFPIGFVADGRYPIPAKAVKTAIDNAPTTSVIEVDGDINLLKENIPKAIWVGTDDSPIEYVPVVRCKDCKRWDDKYKNCTMMGLTALGDSYFYENSFCSFGERKKK